MYTLGDCGFLLTYLYQDRLFYSAVIGWISAFILTIMSFIFVSEIVTNSYLENTSEQSFGFPRPQASSYTKAATDDELEDLY